YASVHGNRSAPGGPRGPRDPDREIEAARPHPLEPGRESTHHYKIHRKMARRAAVGAPAGVGGSWFPRAHFDSRPGPRLFPKSQGAARFLGRSECAARTGRARAGYRIGASEVGCRAGGARLLTAPHTGAYQAAIRAPPASTGGGAIAAARLRLLRG